MRAGPVDVLLRGGRVAAVGPALAAPQGATVVEGRGLLAAPGLVNAHWHSPMQLSHGTSDRPPVLGRERVAVKVENRAVEAQDRLGRSAGATLASVPSALVGCGHGRRHRAHDGDQGRRRPDVFVRRRHRQVPGDPRRRVVPGTPAARRGGRGKRLCRAPSGKVGHQVAPWAARGRTRPACALAPLPASQDGPHGPGSMRRNPGIGRPQGRCPSRPARPLRLYQQFRSSGHIQPDITGKEPVPWPLSADAASPFAPQPWR